MKLDIASYCNREISCSCGRTHFCPIEEVRVGEGALNAIPERTARYRNILLVADENTWAVCGPEIRRLLGKQAGGMLIYRRSGRLVPDEAAVAELEAKITDQTDFVVGIGSGVINDLCKYVTFRHGMDYAVVATAPSMDGYASSGAAMIVSGMKVTYTTHTPRMIIADTDIIKNAPLEMIRSGYGDIIGKFSSLNDWRLSHLINQEYLCEEIYGLVLEVTENVRDLAVQIISREDRAIEFLMNALILIGVTLSLLGTTRPGSGSEHHLSHFFEVTGLIENKPHFLHGTDVGYATAVTAAMREQLCAMKTPRFVQTPDAVREREYARIFGSYASEVKAIQDAAQSYQKNRNPLYQQHWEEMKEIMAACRSAAEITEMLTTAGYDMDAFTKMYGETKIRDAMFYAKDLKDRFSVLWPYYAMVSR